MSFEPTLLCNYPAQKTDAPFCAEQYLPIMALLAAHFEELSGPPITLPSHLAEQIPSRQPNGWKVNVAEISAKIDALLAAAGVLRALPQFDRRATAAFNLGEGEVYRLVINIPGGARITIVPPWSPDRDGIEVEIEFQEDDLARLDAMVADLKAAGRPYYAKGRHTPAAPAGDSS